MEVTVSKILLAVVAVIVPARNAHAGYIYPRPNIAYELPKTIPHFQEELRQKAIKENAIHKTHESVISYSVPLEGLRYLHQYKTVHRPTVNLGNIAQPIHTAAGPNVGISTFNNIGPAASVGHNNIQQVNFPIREPAFTNLPNVRPTLSLPASVEHQSNSVVDLLHHSNIAEVNTPAVKIPTATIKSELPYNIPNIGLKNENIPGALIRPNEFVGNTFSQITIPTNNIPTVNLQLPAQQGDLEINAVQHTNVPAFNIPSVDLPVSIHQQSDLEFTTHQHVINHEVNSELNGPINVLNSVPPKITKHIYFHVPPPEIEEPVVQTIASKKKIYKIIFIKAPSQSMTSNAQLQINSQNSIAPIEEKTIIYVLSKKPESQKVLVPKPVPSEHEVLFVKYSGNPDIAAEQVNDTIEQPQSEFLSTSRLLPGLVNGER